jgi:tetratricopeptide (TPR) repeat protein
MTSKSIKTKDIKLTYEKAVSFYKNGELDKSIHLANLILDLDSRNHQFLNLLGSIYFLKNNFKKALGYVDKALLVKPLSSVYLNTKSIILAELGEYEKSLTICSKTIKLSPGKLCYLGNKSKILKLLGRYEESISICKDCLLIMPDNVDFLNTQAGALAALGKFEESFFYYDKAFSINSNYTMGLYNKSLYLMLSGRIKEGLELYENRWNLKELKLKKKYFKKPLWLGDQSISGKRLLVYSEQGLGDMIQMYRYLAELENLGIQVILESHKSLKNLFSDNAKNVHVVCKGDALNEDDFDYYCPMMSLPLAFKTDVNSIISSPFYIKSSQDLLEKWRKKLPKKTKLFIGLVWAGSSDYKGDRLRSVSFLQFTSLFREDVQFVSLQKEISSSDFEDLKENNQVLHFGEQLRDFSDTAALVECMDLVITVDTSVAHLSGAMGKPTWILTRKIPDWRWLLERDDSPWYPTVKLFRQSSRDDWSDVVLKIKSELDLFTSID